MTLRGLARRAVRDRQGVAAVEFALLSLPFIQICLSVLEFMFLMSGWSTAQYAASQGARYATANPTATASTVAAQAQSYATSMGVTQAMGLTMSAVAGSTAGTTSTSTTMVVTGTYSYTFHFAFWPVHAITMTSKSVAVTS